MFDYKLLESLERIGALKSFDAAANELNITQSAISQRISSLEQKVGAILVHRGKALSLTETGQALANHVIKVKQLELELSHVMDDMTKQHAIKIVVNADSLATWWFPAIQHFSQQHGVMFELMIEDQSEGLKHLEEGLVLGCLCSSEKPLNGTRSYFLGNMEYRFYCTHDFYQRYFSTHDRHAELSHAPAVIFGSSDKLHKQSLQQYGCNQTYPYHICPSSEGLVHMVLNGQGYGLLPLLQAEPFTDQLVEIFPQQDGVQVPLYWHYWHQNGSLLEKLSNVLVSSNVQRLIR